MSRTLEKVALLKSVELFADTPDHVLASLAAITEDISLDAGEIFIHQGALEDEMFVLVEGEAEVLREGEPIDTMSGGEVVGEMEVLAPAPRRASVRTSTPARLLRIHREAFEELMADRPSIARGIIKVLVERVRKGS